MVELALTVVLVIPVPRKIRNAMSRLVMKLNLSDKLGKFAIFVALALGAALIESMSSVQYIQERQRLEHLQQGSSLEHERIFHDLDQQRKFRSERNMYLSGFSLTLLLVIVRICQLMQESVEYEEEVERLTKVVVSEQPASANGVEMTTVKSKQEKKKD